MKNILVTGGCGFIGSNFIHLVFERMNNIRVINLDALTYAGNLHNLDALSDNPDYIFIKGSICDKTLTARIFSEYDIDTVVNFAAESHVDRSILGPAEFIETNIKGTFVLLETARNVWKDNKQRRFLHVSTDEVYGSLGKTGLFTEDTPYAPSSPYSASKASSDHLVRAYFRTYSLPVLVTNCSNNYGPYQFPEKLIPLTIDRIIENENIPVYGKGENVRDWLFVKDHCEALLRVLEKGEFGRTYNIGGNNEIPNIDIVNTICDLTDERLHKSESSKRLISFVKDRPGHDMRYAIDASRIKEELGWSPSYTFVKGIAETVDWYIENRDWVRKIKTGEYKDYIERQYGERDDEN